MITRLGGRRFVMTMGCGIACTALVYFGKISDATFSYIIIATVATYIGGGTVDKFSGKDTQ